MVWPFLALSAALFVGIFLYAITGDRWAKWRANYRRPRCIRCGRPWPRYGYGPRQQARWRTHGSTCAGELDVKNF